jgi:hypothetical protein
MHRWRKFQNRRAVPGFVINSLPKSGTNLLAKAVRSFAGIRRFPAADVWLATAQSLGDQTPAAGETVPVGVGWPQPGPVTTIETALRRLEAGQFAVWHVPYSDTMAALLERLNARMLVMLLARAILRGAYSGV